MTTHDYKFVGKRHPLIEGREKVAGYTQFVADLRFPDMVYGHVVFSPYAHATIQSIDKTEAENIPGVIAVLTADDLPTRNKTIRNRLTATLAKERVLFVGQPVVLVVAESQMIAADAAELVHVEYEELTAVVDMKQAIRHDTPTIWPNGLPKEESDMASIHSSDASSGKVETEQPKYNNTSNERVFTRGDVAAGFASADVIVERTVETESIHQGYMEPHAAVSVPSPMGMGKRGGIDIYAATQGKFWMRDDLSRLLDMPQRDVRIHAMDVGGGFGAKYGILDGLGASAAMALGRPVMVILPRTADFLTTMPAPAMRMTAKVGAKSDGTITAIQIEALTDNGIFAFPHGGMLASNVGGYYRCDNLLIETYEVHTHKPQVGAYRAPAMPQISFALESVIDELAEQLDIDPLAFRMKTVVVDGDLKGNNQPMPTVGFKKCLAAIEAHPLWKNRHEMGDDEGIGLAIGGWTPGSGAADATCRIDSDGTVSLETGNVDLTSNSSAFVLIVAEALGVPPSEIGLVRSGSDGAFAPGSGGSQVTYSVAGAVREAAESVAEQVKKSAADMLEASADDIELIDGKAQVRGVPDKALSLADVASKARGRGSSGPIVAQGRTSVPETAPAASVHLVKVRVNRATGAVTPLNYVCAQDVGFAINPLLVEGQMHGGMLQAVGIALHEAMTYDEAGQLITGSFLDYDLPRMDSTPELDAIMIENPSEYGPYGSRGVGEPPIIGGAAAVVNAVYDAVGYRAAELPIRAESVWMHTNHVS